jgi:hypothetical protein
MKCASLLRDFSEPLEDWAVLLFNVALEHSLAEALSLRKHSLAQSPVGGAVFPHSRALRRRLT